MIQVSAGDLRERAPTLERGIRRKIEKEKRDFPRFWDNMELQFAQV